LAGSAGWCKSVLVTKPHRAATKPSPKLVMITVLLILHLMIAAALVGVVLLQRSEGGALGIGGGGGFMTGRGAANFLTRVTAGLAAAFFVTSLGLTLLATRPASQRSIFDAPASAPAQSKPADNAPPATPEGKSDGGMGKLGPIAPSGPSVPQSK
jgi:preprotein translocase subunit SecG